jgi:hypothetical protein
VKVGSKLQKITTEEDCMSNWVSENLSQDIQIYSSSYAL